MTLDYCIEVSLTMEIVFYSEMNTFMTGIMENNSSFFVNLPKPS